MEYEGEFVVEVPGFIENPMIVVLEKDQSNVTALQIRSTVKYEILEPEYLDILSTSETTCVTRMEKQTDGFYALKGARTSCEYDPYEDDNDYYKFYDGYEI